tara:strand:+ start:249 stop:473 length:225 start_codon:yes stop_codon:yes gene_type:complete
LLFDHPNNPGLGKTALSLSFAPSKVEQTLHETEGSFGGKVNLKPPPSQQAGMGAAHLLNEIVVVRFDDGVEVLF